MSDSLPYGFPPPHRPDPGTGKPVDRDNRPFYPVFGGPLHGRTMRWGGQELLQVPANMRETPRPVGGPGIVADQQTATRMVTYQRRAVGYGWPEMGIDVRCYYLALEHLPAQQTDRLGLIHGFDRMYDTMSLPANVDPATTLAPYVKANHDDGTRIDTGGPMQLYRSAKMVRAAAIAEVQQTNTDGLIRYACKVIWPPMTFTLRPGQDGRAPERGDFVLVYQLDGYVSWCPAAVFQRDYVAIPDDAGAKLETRPAGVWAAEDVPVHGTVDGAREGDA